MAKAKTPVGGPTGPARLAITKDLAIERLKQQIEVGSELLAKAKKVSNRSEYEVLPSERKTWHERNQAILQHAFTDERTMQSYARSTYSVRVGTNDWRDWLSDHVSDTEEYVRRLQSVLDQMDLLEDPVSAVSHGAITKPAIGGKNVFVVHGHNLNIRKDVELLIHKLGLDPVVLSDQVNAGQTVIEKLEKHAGEASYAIIIATADDIGYAKVEGESKARDRARQNVMIELGYFMARLGRNRVALLVESGVEIPSDMGGFAFIQLDEAEQWRQQVGKELKGQGFEVRLEKI